MNPNQGVSFQFPSVQFSVEETKHHLSLPSVPHAGPPPENIPRRDVRFAKRGPPLRGGEGIGGHGPEVTSLGTIR